MPLPDPFHLMRSLARATRRCARHFFAALLIAGAVACGSRDTTATLESVQQLRAKGEFKAATLQLRDLVGAQPTNREARRLLAQLYLQNGEPAAAEDEIRKLVELGVDKQALLPELGKALLLQGKHERLIDEVQVDPTRAGAEYVDIATARGLAYLALGNAADAKVLLDRVQGLDPKNVDALLGLAGIAVGERRLEDADRLVERAIEAQPNNVDAWMLKGDMHRLRDKREIAIEAYGKALALRPGNINAHMHLASIHIDASNFDEASKHVEAVRLRHPNDPMANYLFALVEYRKRNFETARKALAQSLQQNPAHTPTLLLAGVVELSMGSYDAAVTQLRNVLDRAPGSIMARRVLAVALLRAGHVQRAQETIDQLLATFPNDGPLLMLAGEAHLQNNDLSQAARYLERAVKADPDSDRARAGLSVARLMSGQSDRAIAELEASIKVDNAAPQLELVYVAMLLQRRQFDKVLATVQAIEQKQPKNAIVQNLKAAAQIGKGDLRGGRVSLENALALNPRFVPAAINLANLELREGNTRQANRRLEAILDRDPGNVPALAALSSLGPRIGADPNTIVDRLERARRANPTSVRPLVMLADQHLRAGKQRLALSLANEAQKLNPDASDVLEILGAAQLAGNDVVAALGTYSKLALQSPKSPHVLHRLALAQAMNNNYASATLTARRALSIDPNHADSLSLLGQIDLKANRPDGALRVAQQLQKAHPKLPLGFVLEGDALLALGKAAAATKPYQAAAALGERTSALTIKRHRALESAGLAREARTLLDQWTKDNPKDVTIRAYLADLQLAAAQYAAAIDGYLHVLQAQPDNPMVLNNLAWASHKIKDRRAREFAERALKLAPENAFVLDTAGWILVEDGLTDRGIELLQRAITITPDARDTRFHLAQALVKAGNFTRARRELETALNGSGKFENEAKARELAKSLRY